MLQAMQKIDDTGRADLFSFESDYLFFWRDFFGKRRKDKRSIELSDTKSDKGKEMPYNSK